MEAVMAESSVWGALSNEFAAAIEKAGRGVVAVNARRRIPSSGVLWKPGVIVTADHAVGRDEDISITLPGGATAAATLGGRDATTDLAILKFDTSALAAPEIGDASTLRPGNWLLMAGRTFEGGTRGGGALVSVAGPAWRTWRGGVMDQTIRLDRNLHPNFSGGAALDEQGRVVGINTSGLSRIGAVVIPASTVERVVGELSKKGHIGRGYLGVGMQPVRLSRAIRESLKISGETGIMIMGVEAGSPAEKAGVVMGDVLVAIDGTSVGDTDELQQYLTGEHIGKTLKATVVRASALKEVAITVGERAAGN
jgi:S1-C subfamily serine protease